MTSEEAADYLVGKGWAEPAARGVAASLDFDEGGDVLPWGKDRRGLLHDFACAGNRNRKYHSTQLAFLDWELRNIFGPIFNEMMAAPSMESAATSFEQYARAAKR